MQCQHFTPHYKNSIWMGEVILNVSFQTLTYIHTQYFCLNIQTHTHTYKHTHKHSLIHQIVHKYYITLSCRSFFNTHSHTNVRTHSLSLNIQTHSLSLSHTHAQNSTPILYLTNSKITLPYLSFFNKHSYINTQTHTHNSTQIYSLFHTQKSTLFL